MTTEEPIYRQAPESKLTIGTEVVYHPEIGTDYKILKTRIRSGIWEISNQKVVKVEGRAGGMYLGGIELLTDYNNRVTPSS